MWTVLPGTALVCLAVVVGAHVPAAEKPQWTVLAYLSGDGSLEDAALGYLRRLADVPGSEQLRIVAQIDRGPGHSREFGDFADARRVAFVTRTEGGPREWVWTGWRDEVNMGDPGALAEFVVWGLREFPAERVVVLLMGHGSGVRELTGKPEEVAPASGIGYDATSGGDSLTVREIGEVCRRIGEALGGRAISLLALDACFSATAELGCEVAPFVECLTGSPGLIYEPGVPWGEAFGGLAGDPGMEPCELGRRVVELAQAQSLAGETPGAAYVAVDLAHTPQLQLALAGLCDALGSRVDETAPLVTSARAQTPTSGLHAEMLDLRAFLGALSATAEEHGFPEVAEKANEASRVADSMVLRAYAHNALEGKPTCRGWAVFFPPNLTAFPADYLVGSTFARDAGWGAFLAKYLEHLRHLATRTASRGTPSSISLRTHAGLIAT